MPDRRACSADIALSDSERPAKALIRRRQTLGSSGRSGGPMPMTCTWAKRRRMFCVPSMTDCPLRPGSAHLGEEVVERLAVLRGDRGFQEVGEIGEFLLANGAKGEVHRQRLARSAEPGRVLGG